MSPRWPRPSGRTAKATRGPQPRSSPRPGATASLLTQHIFKEDHILYPMADARLSPDQQASLEACFADVEQNIVGEGKHEEFHRLLERLEKAYPA